VVVDDLNVLRAGWGPSEADPILVVDRDGMLAFAVSGQRVKLVAGRARAHGDDFEVAAMTSASNPEWMLPANIPFADLKARDLEECVYWLLDAMGARDLEWRTGGAGGGAPDGGRDLEAVFYVLSPDGELEPQCWWVECKGRSGTVEADAVKSAVNNATARGDLAYLVVVTNTTFSNPTRDWVKTWQETHPRPRIKLWDQTSLERMLSRQPSVVVRLFGVALSPAGRLETVRERFWNKLEYTPVGALQQIWIGRKELTIGPLELVALIANEFAHGNIAKRPWAAQAHSQAIFETLQIGLLNLIYLIMRSSIAGVEQRPIIGTLAHLIMVALQHTSADKVAALIIKLTGSEDGKPLPDMVVELLLTPILDRISSEMIEVCTADCYRFFESDRRTFTPGEDPLATYWYRFEKEGAPEKEEPKSYVRIEATTEPCKVGFALDRERTCPLYHLAPRLDNVAEFLAVIERVSRFRLAQARAGRSAHSP
jgi:hypothetical protein